MAEAKIDPEIRIRPSEELREFVRNFIDESEPEVPENIFCSGPEATFSVSDVAWIRDYMAENQTELKKKWLGFRHFHEMMEKCVVLLPEPVIPPRNPELEARIQRLKAEQAERDYKKMTYNIAGKQSYTEEPLSNQSKRRLLSLGLVGFSILGDLSLFRSMLCDSVINGFQRETKSCLSPSSPL